MKRYLVIGFLMLATILYAASINNPHWIELSTAGKRTLINKIATVQLVNRRVYSGAFIKDYTAYDIKFYHEGIIYVVPLVRVDFIKYSGR